MNSEISEKCYDSIYNDLARSFSASLLICDDKILKELNSNTLLYYRKLIIMEINKQISLARNLKTEK